MEASLKQKLNDDLKQSMRDRNEIKTSTLRLLISAIKYAEMKKQDAEFNKNPNLTDVDLKKITLSPIRISWVSLPRKSSREKIASRLIKWATGRTWWIRNPPRWLS